MTYYIKAAILGAVCAIAIGAASNRFDTIDQAADIQTLSQQVKRLTADMAEQAKMNQRLIDMIGRSKPQTTAKPYTPAAKLSEPFTRNYDDPANWLHGIKPSRKAELFKIVMAIRVAENGGPGKEWGILHPSANTYDLQMAWATATVIKNFCRWIHAGEPDTFITYLGNRYCPPDAHPLNRHWVKNVTNALRRNHANPS